MRVRKKGKNPMFRKLRTLTEEELRLKVAIPRQDESAICPEDGIRLSDMVGLHVEGPVCRACRGVFVYQPESLGLDKMAQAIGKEDPEGWAEAGRILDRAEKAGLLKGDLAAAEARMAHGVLGTDFEELDKMFALGRKRWENMHLEDSPAPSFKHGDQ